MIIHVPVSFKTVAYSVNADEMRPGRFWVRVALVSVPKAYMFWGRQWEFSVLKYFLAEG